MRTPQVRTLTARPGNAARDGVCDGYQAISYRALHATIASGRVRLATDGGVKIAR